jgi:hypothetical protein
MGDVDPDQIAGLNQADAAAVNNISPNVARRPVFATRLAVKGV